MVPGAPKSSALNVNHMLPLQTAFIRRGPRNSYQAEGQGSYQGPSSMPCHAATHRNLVGASHAYSQHGGPCCQRLPCIRSAIAATVQISPNTQGKQHTFPGPDQQFSTDTAWICKAAAPPLTRMACRGMQTRCCSYSRSQIKMAHCILDGGMSLQL